MKRHDYIAVFGFILIVAAVSSDKPLEPIQGLIGVIGVAALLHASNKWKYDE